VSDLLSLSPEQARAVDIEKNISVSAGAGSGKTRVLTGRFLKLLESGLPMEKIAAITFTEKAALEMKERIRKVLLQKIDGSCGEAKKEWQRELDKLSSANISTIHGFCSRIVRENSAFLGLDFNFDIMSEIDRKLTMEEIAVEVLEDYYNKPQFSDLARALTETYGENYRSGKLLEDLKGIRTALLDRGADIKEACESGRGDMLSEFIFEILKQVEDKYRDFKLQRDLLDYNDLETLTSKLLENRRLCERYKNRYTRFLVDEFQDTNEIQKKIIYSLTAEDGKLMAGRLFIVGDFKQSIYGFRGANFMIFKEVSKDIGIEGQVALSTCYRSKNEIIHGVNEIFCHLVEDYENLKPPAEGPSEEKRIFIVNYKKGEEKKDAPAERVKEMIINNSGTIEDFKISLQEMKENSSRVVLEEVQEDMTVMKGIKLLMDKGLSLRDICILVRTKNLVPGIESQLRRRNIPYCIIGGRGFYEKEEVQNILNLYQIVVEGFNHDEEQSEKNSSLDFKLFGVLRSALFNIPDDVLLRIKLEKSENLKARDYLEAAEFTVDGMTPGKDKAALLRACSILRRLVELKDRLAVCGLLNAIVELCDLQTLLLSEEGGVQKYRNVEKLLREAEKYDKKEMFSPEGFLRYVELLREHSKEDSEASLDTEDSSALKIMTIHQSKGLEFKGVIIPGIGADQLSISSQERFKPNLVCYRGKILSKKDLEIKVSASGAESGCSYEGYHKEKLLREVEESIRLLYVAMTRAEDYVVLTGAGEKAEPVEIRYPEDRIENLNSFGKQINYSVKLKNSAGHYVEYMNAVELPDLGRLENRSFEEEEIDYEVLRGRFDFRGNYKPRSMVSASAYMKYLKSPGQFYVENILGIDPAAYEKSGTESQQWLNSLEEECPFIEQGKYEYQPSDNRYIYDKGISPSQLGSLVHKILEHVNEEDSEEAELIYLSIREVLGAKFYEELREGKDEALQDVLLSTLKRYLENYKTIEKNTVPPGKLVLSQNETEYLLAPLEDRRMMITGFIDRLQVFEKDGKYTAVITDYKTNRIKGIETLEHIREMYEKQLNLYGKSIKELLHIEGRTVDHIKLQLYLLDTGEVLELPYDEERVVRQLRDMDRDMGTGTLSQRTTNIGTTLFVPPEGIF
jgi:ATP-dependent helicase/nuclease subunit A